MHGHSSPWAFAAASRDSGAPQLGQGTSATAIASRVRCLVAQPQSPVRTALAGLIGNVLEWFDFAVYGYFAGDIGKLFFPASNETAQQLYTFAVFALGFIARPIGSIVLGMVGDRVGRRALLTISIGLMGGATLALGLLPTHAQIGAAAPALLVRTTVGLRKTIRLVLIRRRLS